MICKHILKEPEVFLYTVKWFQVLLYNNPNLTSVICFQLGCSI